MLYSVACHVFYLLWMSKWVRVNEEAKLWLSAYEKKNVREFNEYRHLVSLFLTQSSCLFFSLALSASSNNLWASCFFSTYLNHQVKQHWIKPHAVNKHQIRLLSCYIFLSTRVTGTLSTWTILSLSSIHILIHFQCVLLQTSSCLYLDSCSLPI